MINLSWKNSEQVIENFRRKGPRIIAVLTTKISILMSQLSSYVVSQKLSGQMASPRSGKLRASVHALETKIVGTSIQGRVEAAGSPLGYGNILHEGSRAHEVLSVKKKALSFILDGKRRAFASVQIPAQTARPYMRTAEEENTAMIVAELEKSLREVIEE